MPAHSRSKNGVAEPVIGPATSGRTRWLAYVAGHPDPVGIACRSEMAGTSPAMTYYYRKLPQKRWTRVQASSSALVAVA
jgi:hypothetical protein